MNKIFLILLVLVSYPVFADGPPVDKEGHVRGDHVVLTLYYNQEVQIGRSRILVFTSEQLSFLRKINDNFPDSIFVVTPFYNDCTCGLLYGIWFQENKIAIPKYIFEYMNDIELLKANRRKPAAEFKNGSQIYLDINGQIYFNGKEMSLGELKMKIEILGKSENRKKGFCIGKPPVFGKNKIDAMIQQLSDYAKLHDVRVRIGG